VRNGVAGIYFFSLVTGIERQLPFGGQSGSYLFENVTGATAHLMLWHMPTDSVFQVNVNPSSSQFLPDIDGNRIVYTDDRIGSLDIYMYTFTNTISDAWPMFHYNLHHAGYSTSKAPNANQTKWTYKTGGLIASSPTVADGKLYVGSDDGNVYALDASTGTQIWSHATGGSVESSPAVVDGMVFVGSYDSNVYALNASTGTLIWNYATGSVVFSSPAVADGRLYVGSEDGNVYAFGVHDLSVTDVHSVKKGCVPMPTVCKGMNVDVNVTVENHGSYAETFNVTLYVNSTRITEQTVALDVAQTSTLTLTWNTGGTTEYANYTFTATATQVYGETNVNDNTVKDGTVTITHTGDVNGDGMVDIFDIVRVALAFGARTGDTNWDPNANINNDNIIDIFDIVIVALPFGWHQP
jgi:beta propeller repeat protein